MADVVYGNNIFTEGSASTSTANQYKFADPELSFDSNDSTYARHLIASGNTSYLFYELNSAENIKKIAALVKLDSSLPVILRTYGSNSPQLNQTATGYTLLHSTTFPPKNTLQWISASINTEAAYKYYAFGLVTNANINVYSINGYEIISLSDIFGDDYPKFRTKDYVSGSQSGSAAYTENYINNYFTTGSTDLTNPGDYITGNGSNLPYLIDNNVNTGWSDTGVHIDSQSYVIFDLTTPKTLGKLNIYPSYINIAPIIGGPTPNNRVLAKYVSIYGTNNTSSWNYLTGVTVANTAIGMWSTFNFNNEISGSFRYYRLGFAGTYMPPGMIDPYPLLRTVMEVELFEKTYYTSSVEILYTSSLGGQIGHEVLLEHANMFPTFLENEYIEMTALLTGNKFYYQKRNNSYFDVYVNLFDYNDYFYSESYVSNLIVSGGNATATQVRTDGVYDLTYGANSAFDHNTTTTRWATPVGTAQGTINYDFGEYNGIANKQRITKYKHWPLTTATPTTTGNSGSWWKNLHISASNDNTNWIPLFVTQAINEVANYSGKSWEYTFENPNFYRYYKFYYDDSHAYNQGVSIYEIQLTSDYTNSYESGIIPKDKFNEIMHHKNDEVYFYPHADGAAIKDWLIESASFKITEMRPYYLTQDAEYDGVKLRFEATDDVFFGDRYSLGYGFSYGYQYGIGL